MIATTVEIEGTLDADGRLILDERPALPPGRVSVALRTLALAERLPGPPSLDDAIPAPIDLPYSAVIVRIQPRATSERLPELPSVLAEEDQ